MFQLRIYTLRSPHALQRYATVHWARHLATFTTFVITTHGVWTRQVITSAQFADDMAGFDADDLVDVQTTLLDPTSFSPIR